MLKNVEEYPLVTFAIFSYNQEDFIEAAVQGALDQDYPNLEIIVSDDSSKDSTFKKTSNMISNYSGNHTVRLNKNNTNICTLSHFFKVIELAEGKLLVAAAGDDISKPDRVSKMVSFWQKNSASVIFSNYQIIDENDAIKSEIYSPNQRSELLELVFKKLSPLDLHGASCAYDMHFLKNIPKPEGRFLFEDTYVTFMIGLYNKNIVRMNEDLVYYRRHSNSISNSSNSTLSVKKIKNKQIKASYNAANKYDLYVIMREIYLTEYNLGNVSKIDIDRLDLYINKFKIESSWIKSSPKSMLGNISKYRNDKDFLKWILPRTLGLRFFAYSKLLKNIIARKES